MMGVAYPVLASTISGHTELPGAISHTSRIYAVAETEGGDMPSEEPPRSISRQPMVTSRGGKGDVRGGRADAIILCRS
jgi:hypothetical protein